MKAMSPEELQADKEKIFVDMGDGEVQKHHLQRFMEIEAELETRAAREQALEPSSAHLFLCGLIVFGHSLNSLKGLCTRVR
jgi:hypothetical protein